MEHTPTRTTTAKVLLVDDLPDNLELLREVLAVKGYEILVARDGEETLAIVEEVIPDLVLLDVMLPDMDGFEVCRRLKADERMRQVPIIFITARGEADDIVDGFASGGVDYIAKPFHRGELLVRIDTHLENRRLVTELTYKNEALQAEIAHRRAITEERDHLADHLSLLSAEEARRWGIAGFVGQSPILAKILGDIQRLQQAPATSVLIGGESGTGKELVARAIHYGSGRAQGHFMAVNCSALPGELADSLFFGHVKGAFTGADRDRAGYFELAEGGTLFLDEIGEMPTELQAKLLRVLEERTVLPVGGARERPVDVRIVAASNVDLEQEVGNGRFRRDLYYRLATFPVHVPPLRERQEDIPLLVNHFLALFADDMSTHSPSISDDALAALSRYSFPGNIRELKNIIERALIESGGGSIDLQHLHLGTGIGDTPAQPIDTSDLPFNLEQAELELIRRAMARTEGNISEAARLLGINRMKIYRRLSQAGDSTDPDGS